MEEVYRIADRITILRDGQRLFTKRLERGDARADRRGHRRAQDRGRARIPGTGSAGVRTALLEARHLQRRHPGQRRQLHPARRRDPRPGRADGQRPHRACPGAVRHRLDQLRRRSSSAGSRSRLHNPRDASRPRHRARARGPPAQGLVLDHSVRENLLLPLLGKLQRGPFVSTGPGKALAKDCSSGFRSRSRTPVDPVRLLSGGNQQKVVHRQVARHRPGGADHGRAHRRRRHRHQDPRSST